MTKDSFDTLMIKFKEAALHFKSDDAVTIDSAVFSLMQQHDKRFIGLLLLSLDDDANEDAGMFSLIHAAESFDDDTYVNELLFVLPQLKTKAPKWASIVLMRVLNNEGTKDKIVRSLRQADFNLKESVVWLCEKINERSPSFLNKTIPLLLATKQA